MSLRGPARPRSDLIEAVRASLKEAADSDRALQMQAYMKSVMPYYGVRMPEVRKRVRSILNDLPIEDRDVWQATLLAMYDAATHREERYAALALASHRSYREFATAPGALTLFEHLIRVGAWWDLVDETSHRVGDVLRAHRREASPVIGSWATTDDLWLRRTSIICQVGHRSETDLVLLASVVTPNVEDREFFIRKAIGWALREVAYVDPAWVRAFIDKHPKLSPLSIREATKHIGPAASLKD